MKKNKRLILSLLFSVMLCAISVLLTSCGDKDEIKIEASTNSIEMFVGRTEEVSFEVSHYSFNGEVDLSIYDSRLSATTEIENNNFVEVTKTYKSGVTNVSLKALRGGTISLIATTLESENKNAEVVINIREFSTEIVAKEDNLFLTTETELTPDFDMFLFSENCTEKNVQFYFVENEDIILNSEIKYDFDAKKFKQQTGDPFEALKFTSCKLENGKIKVITQDLEGNEIEKEYATHDLQKRFFIAEYYNQTNARYYYAYREFKVFFGLKEDDFKVQDIDNNDIDACKLIMYKSDQNQKNIYVTVPKYNEIDEVVFDYTINTQIVSVRKEIKSQDENIIKYEFTINSKVAYQTSCDLKLNLYYKNYKDGDSKISITKNVKIDILVLPLKFNVNGYSEDDENNNYTFFNYNLSDYGWKTFDVFVSQNASVSGYTVEFESDYVRVKQNGIDITDGQLITDLNNPLMIRGRDTDKTTDNGEIKLTIESPIYESGDVKMSYTIKYQLKKGVKSIEFEKDLFEYSSTHTDRGVYVGINSDETEFDGVYADAEFEYADVYSYTNSKVVEVKYKKYVEKEDGYHVVLQIKPLQVGIETFNVILNNGKSIDITFRVVNEIKDFNIYQSVESDAEKIILTEKEGGYNLIVKNNYIQNFGEIGKFNIKANSEDVITGLEINVGTFLSSKIISNESFAIQSINNGDTTFTVGVEGYLVENWELKSKKIEKTIDAISYTVAKELIICDESENPINNLTIYRNREQSNEYKVVKLSVDENSLGNNAYYFYDYKNDKYIAEKFDKKFIYWTASVGMYNGDGEKYEVLSGDEDEDFILGSNTGIKFNPATLEIKVNSNEKEYSFVLYANIRQPGEVARQRAINVSVKKYQDITMITSSIVDNKIIFDDYNNKRTFIVSINPITATNLDIECVPDSNFGEYYDVVYDELEKGVFSVTIALKQSMESIPECVLGIAPKAWVSDGSVVNSRQLETLWYKCVYANGTKANPYYLNNAKDVENINKNTTAYYIINSTIDMTGKILPYCDFSGTLKGVGNAKIVGITITAAKPSFFKDISGNIEDITFEGKFDIQDESSESPSYGLLGQTLTRTGTIENIKVYINESKIKTPNKDIVFGGVVANNEGTIEKGYNCLLFMNDQLQVTCSNSSKIGGIAGENSGYIISNDKAEKSGYSNYLAYVNISAYGIIGGVAGENNGFIQGKEGNRFTAVGGNLVNLSDQTNTCVAGIAGVNTESAVINYLTTRTFVKGYGASIICKNKNSSYDGVKYINIESINKGMNSLDGIMAVRYNSFDDTCFNTLKVATNNDDYKNQNITIKLDGVELEDKIAINNDGKGTITFDDSDDSIVGNIKLYYGENEVTEYFTIEITGDEEDKVKQFMAFGGDFGNVDDISFKSYSDYWDYYICNKEENEVYVQKQFDKSSDELENIELNDKGYNFKLESSDSDDPKVFSMYYFEATSFYNEYGKISVDDLTSLQNKLDVLNIYDAKSIFYPIIIDINSVLTSDSNLIKIDENNTITVLGTGIAKIHYESLLNIVNKGDFYVYILNYFNYKKLEGKSLLSAEGYSLTGDIEMNAYSDREIMLKIMPILSLEKDELKKEIKIDKDGVVYLENAKIKLKQNNEFTAVYTSDDDILDHAYVTANNVGFGVTKKKGTASNVEDKVTVYGSLKKEIDGKNYSAEIGKKIQATINYKEGTRKIYSTYDSFVMNTSQSINDIVYIDSDDEEELNWIIESDNFKQKGDEEGLFNVSVSTTGKNLVELNISINKDSDEYKNRNKINIFKNYTLKYMGKTNQQEVYKIIEFRLSDEVLEYIIVDNYSKENVYVKSNKIIPAVYGKLAVTMVPENTDFEYILVENDDINYQNGSTNALFEIGYLNDSAKFVAISTVFNTDTGVMIKKSDLVEALAGRAFDGQFYIRYMFGNNSSVVDGGNVKINISILDINKQNIIPITAVTYTIMKNYFIDISINGKTQNGGTYYLARGLSYLVDTEVYGYDSISLSIEGDSSNLIKLDGNILNIDSNVTNRSFEIKATGTRVDFDGKVKEYTRIIECYVMDYIVNYHGENNIIAGMDSNGKLSSMIGVKQDLKIDLLTYGFIEYNINDAEVVKEVDDFIRGLTTNGVWKIFYNRNGIENVVDESSDLSNTLNSDTKLKNQYFEFDGLSYYTNRVHNSDEMHYYLTYNAGYKMDTEKGIYACDNSGATKINLKFTINSYLLDAEDTPTPIYKYNDLKNMEKDRHYILMENIEITPDDFEPITANCASLDGNGCFIKFVKNGEGNSNFNVSKLKQVGIFKEVSSSSVLKNIRVDISKGVEFTISSTEGVSFGLLAELNNGKITNAKMSGHLIVKFDNDNEVSKDTLIAGLVANNSGYITNSQISVSITASASIAGVVGINNKKIASTYFKGGVITNNANNNDKFSTAGFVLENKSNGQIITSYTSGNVDSTQCYSSEDVIKSKVFSSAFVDYNDGLIRDCYANIKFDYNFSSSDISGFVDSNGGDIIRCFTTSILGNNDQSKHHFVNETQTEENGFGYFENCFYLEDTGINESIESPEIKGIKNLKKTGFADMENFAAYAYGKSMGAGDYNNVWVYSNSYNDVFNYYNVVTSSWVSQTFNTGRLELVSANIISESIREINNDGNTTCEEGSTINYSYRYLIDELQYGQLHNPYIIDDADIFELRTSSKYLNSITANYRLISDLDYSVYEQEITTYSISINGIIEGNGMEISAINIKSDKQLDNAGWIGCINGNNCKAGIFNLTINPKNVFFNNSSIVGTLVGKVDNANVQNIKIYNTSNIDGTDNAITVVGKHIVGGVIGLVQGASNIINVESQVGAKAAFIQLEENENKLKENVYMYSNNISQSSYAGGVIGYVYSKNGIVSKIKNIHVKTEKVLYVIGGCAGFALGGVSSGVEVSNVNIDMSSNMYIRASLFGGLCIGESMGNLKGITIKSSNNKDQNIFLTDLYLPMAVGGVVGFMLGGSIDMIEMHQSFKNHECENLDNILYTGGVVGLVKRLDGYSNVSKISNIVVNGSISVRNTAGGVVGYASTNIELNEICLGDEDNPFILNMRGCLSDSNIGGFIGKADSGVIIENSSDESSDEKISYFKINVDNYAYKVQINLGIGSLVGNKPSSITVSNIKVKSDFDLKTTKIGENSEEKKIEINSEIIKVNGDAIYTFEGTDSSVTDNVKLTIVGEDVFITYHEFKGTSFVYNE